MLVFFSCKKDNNSPFAPYCSCLWAVVLKHELIEPHSFLSAETYELDLLPV